MEGKVPFESDVPINWRARETKRHYMFRHLAGFGIFYAILLVVLMVLSLFNTGCVTEPPAPTPAFVPIQYERIVVKREMIEPGLGDDMPVEVELGELKQALLDSESLDGLIVVTNKTTEDLAETVEKYNKAVEWIYRDIEARRYRAGVVAGGVGLALISGIMIGLGMGR